MNLASLERRDYLTDSVELRPKLVAEENKPKSLTCAFVVYEQLSLPMNKPALRKEDFREIIHAGAFSKSLTVTQRDVMCLVDHELKCLLGRTASGTLTLNDGPAALFGDVQLPDTSYAEDLAVLVARGDVRGCSFGFKVLAQRWERLKDGTWIRHIDEGVLPEVSVTAAPQFDGTWVLANETRSTTQDHTEQPICVARGRAKLAALRTTRDR